MVGFIKSYQLNFLKQFAIINFIILSFATFYTLETKKDQFIVAYISVTATIALFFVVFTYHMFTEMCSKTSSVSGEISLLIFISFPISCGVIAHFGVHLTTRLWAVAGHLLLDNN